jgi:hypothetical protein
MAKRTVWGLESRLPKGDWRTYYMIYPTKRAAEVAGSNGGPAGVEWRVVEFRKVTASDAVAKP